MFKEKMIEYIVAPSFESELNHDALVRQKVFPLDDRKHHCSKILYYQYAVKRSCAT